MIERFIRLSGLSLVVGLCLLAARPATAESVPSAGQASSHHHEHSTGAQQGTMPFRLPPSGLDPEEDVEYSRFMHHSSGMAMLILGAFVLADRLTAHRHRLLGFGIGGTWISFGLFLFVFSDLEAWPIGPAGFMESFSLPTAHEWIQHHLLSMIPMVLGVYMMLLGRKQSKPWWKYLAAGVAVLGGAALSIHQHLDHPGMDLVNLQHRVFALTSFFIGASLVLEENARFTWKGKMFLLPVGLLLLGIQLALYVE